MPLGLESLLEALSLRPQPLFCVTQGENAAKKKEREKEAEEQQEARCLLRNYEKVSVLAH
jgi:hypothetical protein